MKIAIKSLRIVGCGPIDDIELDFTDAGTGMPRPFTLLAGSNGSGKTTIIELIAALFEIVDPTRSDEATTPSAALLRRTKFAQLNLQVDNDEFAIISGDRAHNRHLPANWCHTSGEPGEQLEFQGAVFS